MEIKPLKYQFSLAESDRESIRQAIHDWGKPGELADGFNGGKLYEYFERWENFVSTDWTNWDSSEYNHDIGCRVWIQVAIEHASPETRSDLERAVKPLDDRFKAHMAPATSRGMQRSAAPLSAGPYFWDTHTIHPGG